MKKQSRTKKKILTISIILFISIIIIAGSFLIYIYTQNYIKLERVDNKAYSQTKKVVREAEPIYINNLLIGGVNGDKWVSKDDIYGQENNVKQEEIDIYGLTGKVGTYEVTAVNKETKTNNIYITTNRLVSQNEYIAIPSRDKNMSVGETSVSSATDDDKKAVKKALGIYRFLNNTVKINEVYNVTMKNGEDGRVICATSDGKNKLGVYSVIVYSTEKSEKIIKYCYVKDSKRAVDWPIYSLKFVYDLNSDGISEIILQETNDYQVKYTVMQYRKDKFYEVLSEKVNI